MTTKMAVVEKPVSGGDQAGNWKFTPEDRAYLIQVCRNSEDELDKIERTNPRIPVEIRHVEVRKCRPGSAAGSYFYPFAFKHWSR